jgi:hypothetical protein
MNWLTVVNAAIVPLFDVRLDLLAGFTPAIKLAVVCQNLAQLVVLHLR